MTNRVFTTLITFTILLTNQLYAQYENYSAEDGTQIQLDIRSVNPDKLPKLHAALGVFGIEGIKLLNISYYEPELFMINAYAGTNSFLIDGNYFFSSTEKNKSQKQSVKRSGSTEYVLKFDIKKRVSWGIHGGVSYADYSSDATNINTAPFNATGVFLGGTLLGAKYASFRIKDAYRMRKGHSLSRLNADVIFYVNRTPNTYDPNDLTPPNIDDLSRPIGARLYYDGLAAIWSRGGRFTFHYQIGVALHASKDLTFPGFLGLGLGYSFVD